MKGKHNAIYSFFSISIKKQSHYVDCCYVIDNLIKSYYDCLEKKWMFSAWYTRVAQRKLLGCFKLVVCGGQA